MVRAQCLHATSSQSQTSTKPAVPCPPEQLRPPWVRPHLCVLKGLYLFFHDFTFIYFSCVCTYNNCIIFAHTYNDCIIFAHTDNNCIIFAHTYNDCIIFAHTDNNSIIFAHTYNDCIIFAHTDNNCIIFAHTYKNCIIFFVFRKVYAFFSYFKSCILVRIYHENCINFSELKVLLRVNISENFIFKCLNNFHTCAKFSL